MPLKGIIAALSEHFDDRRLAICVADGESDDLPLIYINPSFSALTGYEPQDCEGKNCRFLSRGLPVDEERQSVRQALADRKRIEIVLPNRRADGAVFLNMLIMDTVKTGSGARLHMASQFDVSGLMEEEAEANSAAMGASEERRDTAMQAAKDRHRTRRDAFRYSADAARGQAQIILSGF